MPVLINEVVADIEPGKAAEQHGPAETQSPLSNTEFELIRTLALIEERKLRLTID